MIFLRKIVWIIIMAAASKMIIMLSERSKLTKMALEQSKEAACWCT